jgi:hypothetical protein
MTNLVSQFEGKNVIVRNVENKLYLAVENNHGELVFPILSQNQINQIVKELNLEILN